MTARLVQVLTLSTTYLSTTYLSTTYLSTTYLTVIKYAVAIAFLALPVIAQATPTNFGTFKIANQSSSNGSANGTYITDAGATGKFTITRFNNNNGYNGVTFKAGNNGIEILNHSNLNEHQDEFSYKFKITPDDKNSIHTIKIGQASYTTAGNSDIGRLELKYHDQLVDGPMKATLRNNPAVPYSYASMGDYFMGEKINETTLRSGNCAGNFTNGPQLRANGDHDLYYYKIENLKGSGDECVFKPTLSSHKVSFKVGEDRELPPNGNESATFAEILKSSSHPNTYPALSTGEIANQFKFIRYGVVNADSNYVIAVENASYVTIEFKGIMRNYRDSEEQIDGETGNEWISFGVESPGTIPVNYSFSGNVFNDNGGITDAQADANTTGGIYNNNQYFNGIFNTPTEKGITGSTVTLVDKCKNPTKTYATQTLTSTNANEIGKYQLSVLSSKVKSQSSVCIIETNVSATYPVRTTTDTKLINLATDSYVNNNFGRVIAANAALVLEKEQAANDCNLSDLTNVTYSKDPLASSETGAGADIRPGQCIAYKITATNRANLDINDFIMQDTLQKKDLNKPLEPTVTSVLAKPLRAPNDFNDGLKIGENGTVKTFPFTLSKRTNRSFYFNTQYGSTQSN